MDISIKNRTNLVIPETKNCIHTRKLIQMIDVDSEDQRIHFFKKHSKTCLPCQRKLKEIERSLIRFEFFVPKPNATKEMRAEYENEIHQLLKNVGLTNEAKFKQKRIALSDKFQNVVKDIELVLNSKKFLAVVIVVSGFSFGILSLLLK